MLTITYAPEDKALAERIQADLTEAGYTFSPDVPSKRDHILLMVVSQAGVVDSTVTAQMIDALEAGQHVIPVQAGEAKLPRLIDNLQPLDFRTGYPIAQLKQQIEFLSSPDAPRPMVTLTPSRRRRNRLTGAVIGVAVFVVFSITIYAFVILGLRAPNDEIEDLQTRDAVLINTEIGATLDAAMPVTTEDAVNFGATVEAVPSLVRPFVIRTATAIAPSGE